MGTLYVVSAHLVVTPWVFAAPVEAKLYSRRRIVTLGPKKAAKSPYTASM